MNKKVLLMILDGWGEGEKNESNAIWATRTPVMDKLRKEYPYAYLDACGEAVGLPKDQMGNSEVGHTNIGAGRVVPQDLMRVNIAVQQNTLKEREEVKNVMEYVKKEGKALHFMGLLSRGGIHSSLEHLYAFLKIAKEYSLDKVYIHAIMDGRDTNPMSGKEFLKQTMEYASKTSGKIASVVGRFYTMDRDKRWERVKVGYDLMTAGIGKKTQDPLTAMEESYANGVTDEFIKPIVCTNSDGRPVATLQPGDAVIFYNYRNDRAREITQVLTQEDMPDKGMKTIPLYYCCLTPYDDNFKGLHILFDKEKVCDTLAEVVSKAGLKQLHIAETEKYAHVTFFINGGLETPFEGEDRILVPSPKVETYDLKPEMSAPEVADKVINAIKTDKYNLIVLNFANPDMLGHTGVYPAICKAIETIDTLSGKVINEAQAHGYSVLVTADHGNADHAYDIVQKEGKEVIKPNTAHSLNKVQFIAVDKEAKSVEDGILADVTPTILHLMGLQKSALMTGHSLINF